MTWRRLLTSDDEIELDVLQKSTNYTLTDGDDVVLCSGSITITLHDAASARQKAYRIKKVDAGGTLTINSNGGAIDGQPSLSLTDQYASVTLVPDGSDWWKF